MNEGWIKLHGRMLEWEWFSDSAMVQMWIFFLLKANFRERKWRGIVIPRGSFITSIATISQELHLSTQTVRTCINRLKLTNEITSETTNRYTIITICKYDDYQVIENQTNKQNNKQANKQVTNKEQTNNKQITTTIDNIDIKIDRKIDKEKDNSYELSKKKNFDVAREQSFDAWAQKSIPTVQKMKEPLTLFQFDKLSERFGKQSLLEVLMAMDNNLELLKKYKSAAKTALNWLKRREPEQKSKVEETMTAMQRVNRLYRND